MLGVSPANSRVAMSYAFQLSWQDTKTTELPFPDSTCGFFYFHPAPNGRPRISGEVRFRMARNPTEFDAGEDLKIPSGEVWSRPVYSLAAHRNLRPLYAKLVEEGLVAPDLHDAIKARVEGKRRRLMYTRCTILYTLQDPFIFDLSSPTKSFWALTENDLAVGELQKIFTDTRDTYGTFNPYAGVYNFPAFRVLPSQLMRRFLRMHSGSFRTVLFARTSRHADSCSSRSRHPGTYSKSGRKLRQ